MTKVLEAALAWHAAGAAVLPAKADGSKAPGAPTGKPCKPIPYPVGEDEF